MVTYNVGPTRRHPLAMSSCHGAAAPPGPGDVEIKYRVRLLEEISYRACCLLWRVPAAHAAIRNELRRIDALSIELSDWFAINALSIELGDWFATGERAEDPPCDYVSFVHGWHRFHLVARSHAVSVVTQ